MRVLVFLLLACGPTHSMTGDGGERTADGGSLPTTLAELQAFARSGAYLGWAAEPAPHASKGPHGGTVRTFVNPPLHQSLKSGEPLHPAGSVVVKELRSGEQLTGYAIDVKRSDGEWVFYEGFLPSLDQYFFVGTSNLCGNCHRPGSDFVLTAASALP